MNSEYQMLAELQDPFLFEDGSRVATAEDWRRRRDEIARSIIDIEYGGLPPVPKGLRVEKLHTLQLDIPAEWTYTQYRLVLEEYPAFHFRLDVLVPARDEPVPVVLTGDGCWCYVTDEVSANVIGRGFALAVFSRTEIAPDIYNNDRDTGLYPAYPEHSFGALAAWAWGYHRAIDALEQIEGVDATRVAITGHSRGGKTTLLAGATDERIAVTNCNGSGAGGAGSFLYLGPECEKLADGMRGAPYWYGPKFHEYANRETELPFDQHFLKAMVAPRALLDTEGLDDLWSNPVGAMQTQLAAKEVYRFLGATDRIGQVYRPGGHDHGPEDWRAFLDFAQWHLQGIEPSRAFDAPFDKNPFADMKPAFSWEAPRGIS